MKPLFSCQRAARLTGFEPVIFGATVRDVNRYTTGAEGGALLSRSPPMRTEGVEPPQPKPLLYRQLVSPMTRCVRVFDCLVKSDGPAADSGSCCGAGCVGSSGVRRGALLSPTVQ